MSPWSTRKGVKNWLKTTALEVSLWWQEKSWRVLWGMLWWSTWQHMICLRTASMDFQQIMYVSTTLCLWRTDLIDHGDPAYIMYLDLHKIFDAAPHRRLLEKVAACGIEGKLHRWIEAFLSSRTWVDINAVKSEWKSVGGGVSQGSGLGPSLFMLFINDVPDGFINSVYVLTDDTKIIGPVKSQSQKDSMHENLNKANKRSDKWQLPFNSNKCKVLHVRRSYTLTAYQMSGIDFQ